MAPPDRTQMPLPPDAYVVLALVLAVALEWAAPLYILPPLAITSPATIAGIVLAACGLAVEVAAARELSRARTTTRPNDEATALVRQGIYRRSRNPFYCGMILLLAGLFLAASLDWGLFVLPLFWLALDRFVVPFEERRLEARFGAAYLTYAAATRRWL